MQSVFARIGLGDVHTLPEYYAGRTHIVAVQRFQKIPPIP